MISPALLFETLTQCGVSFFTGVPDSLLKSFCAHLADHCGPQQHITAANEGSALAMGVGHHLASGKVPLIYLQNSGLGNLINPLVSLADAEVYAVPLLMLIGWRGQPGIKDEPQHVKQGRITPALLELLEVPYQLITADTTPAGATQAVQDMVTLAVTEQRPCALLVAQGSFTEYRQAKTTQQAELSREQAIEILLSVLEETDAVVCTTGFASRELFELRANRNQGHNRDFLTVGSMGHANQIALGIALEQPHRQVFCLDGDGALVMHLGGVASCAASGCHNLKHIVLNNGAHDSVGGQPTIADSIDLTALAKSLGYRWVGRVDAAIELLTAASIFRSQQGPALLEITLKKGARSDLGRPTTTPVANKLAFTDFLRQ